jgi:hypothetical protein
MELDDSSPDEATQAIVTFIKRLYKAKNYLSPNPPFKREPIRIYIDGGFDLIHSGHYNAIR